MVGQSRHSKHRSARAARSAFAAGTKKARRTVGKKLQASTQPVPVAQASFDPSTVRNSVQIGLRISSTLRSEKGRESKSPSSLEGSDMSTGVLTCQLSNFALQTSADISDESTIPIDSTGLSDLIRSSQILSDGLSVFVFGIHSWQCREGLWQRLRSTAGAYGAPSPDGLPAGHGCLKGKHSANRSEVFLCFRLTLPLNRQITYSRLLLSKAGCRHLLQSTYTGVAGSCFCTCGYDYLLCWTGCS
eukprot:s4458_g1.t1